ncbi:MAG: metallophosphoesterase family protein [Syntrophotaleaceae bacterium]
MKRKAARGETGKEKQEEGRLLAVGDIHGQLSLLRDLLRQVDPAQGDQLVFLGDYIDRGPDSKGVINFLLELRQQFPGIVFLKGNHEAMLLDYLAGRDRLLYLLNGGSRTLDSYTCQGQIHFPEEHLHFLQHLPLYHETDQFLFVHAGLRPGIDPAGQVEEDLLWIREEFLESNHDWGKTVVFGHTPQKKPLLSGKRIGLDTGAGHGRTLTCCEVRQRRCWTAS